MVLDFSLNEWKYSLFKDGFKGGRKWEEKIDEEEGGGENGRGKEWVRGDEEG